MKWKQRLLNRLMHDVHGPKARVLVNISITINGKPIVILDAESLAGMQMLRDGHAGIRLADAGNFVIELSPVL
jgi:hypothetical protein